MICRKFQAFTLKASREGCQYFIIKHLSHYEM